VTISRSALDFADGPLGSRLAPGDQPERDQVRQSSSSSNSS